MTDCIQYDENGDPFLFNPGDMGTFVESATIHRRADSGEAIVGRYRLKSTAKFTGGCNADGSPTLANDHPPILPEDIPPHVPWPRILGDDPR